MKKRNILKLSLLMAVCLGITSCSGIRSELSSHDKNPKNSVVRIVKKLPKPSPLGYNVDGLGSGCFVKVKNEVFLISAYHVRLNHKKIHFLKYPAEMDSEVYSATFIKADKENDLVAYKLDQQPTEFIEVAKDAPKENEDVRLLGYLAKWRIRTVDPPISDLEAKVFTKEEGDAEDRRSLHYTKMTMGGMSGGACVDKNGELQSIIQGAIIGDGTGRGSSYESLVNFVNSLVE